MELRPQLSLDANMHRASVRIAPRACRIRSDTFAVTLNDVAHSFVRPEHLNIGESEHGRTVDPSPNPVLTLGSFLWLRAETRFDLKC